MLTHKGTQPLRTERLVLRRLRADDAEAMYQNWATLSLTIRLSEQSICMIFKPK